MGEIRVRECEQCGDTMEISQFKKCGKDINGRQKYQKSCRHCKLQYRNGRKTSVEERKGKLLIIYGPEIYN